ncbi:hypothetical protein D3C80_2078010 [compost metagenome]
MCTCSKSSTVASEGKLTVLEIAPETRGVKAAIIRTCPIGSMKRLPVPVLLAVSKIGKCSSFK